MNIELQQTVVELKALKELLSSKAQLEQKLEDIDEELDEEYGLEKPEEPTPPEKPKEPSKPFESEPTPTVTKKSLAITVLSCGFIVLFGIAMLLPMEPLGILVGMFCIILGIGVIALIPKGYSESLKKYEEEMRMVRKYEQDMLSYDEEIKSLDNEMKLFKKKKEEYNIALNAYELKRQECFQKEEEKIAAELTKINEAIYEYEGVVSSKFYGDLSRIIEIIETGRADTLKEALNICVSDKKQDELLAAQNKYNQEKLAADKAHAKEMERQAREQTHALQQQEYAMRKQAEQAEQQTEMMKQLRKQ